MQKTARLAKILLTDEEAREFSRDLEEIFSFARAMTDAEPDFAPDLPNPVTRQDTVMPSLPREKLLVNAPDRTEEYVAVPAVMDAD
ncbi:MAG: Asp-tRNA(Asn)/Glu-tRNA(Gln) amidotransferase subunit GatC [Clostridia bacterium]|nr:Asp-tRNA(Asn)/Glu-tRNA(Gln) amidotransferase subunit GatC [Clostridia bacterium]